jgi:hypothetical protein
MAYPTPMTKLDAVNICLSSMGQPKVTDLTGTAPDAEVAADIVDEVSRKVQNKGWHWNREYHTLTPDANKNILVPSNAVHIDTDRTSIDINVAVRGSRLYNLKDNTYEFDHEVKVCFVVYLNFPDLPASAKDYIATHSARIFQERMLGSTALTNFTEKDELRAWAIMVSEDNKLADRNMLRDSFNTSMILARGFFARGAFR